MLSVEMCITLHDYVDRILRVSQWEIAKRAGCSQAYVSQVMCGALPRARSEKYEPLVQALQLTGREDHFVRMVRNAAKLRALRKHVADDMPLFSYAQMKERGMVVDLNVALRAARRKDA